MNWEYKKAQMLIIQESRRCFWGLGKCFFKNHKMKAETGKKLTAFSFFKFSV